MTAVGMRRGRLRFKVSFKSNAHTARTHTHTHASIADANLLKAVRASPVT